MSGHLDKKNQTNKVLSSCLLFSSPPIYSRPRPRSQLLQAAVKMLTHGLSHRGKEKKKTLSMMRTSTLAWRESIYSFIMFIQQNKQRSGLCCSAERSASITVKFQIKALHSSHFDDHFKACPPPLPHQPPQRRPWLLTLSQATWSFIQTKSTNLLQCVQFEAQRNTRLVIFILNSRWRHSTCK